MTNEQRSERMSEDDVHRKALDMWPTILEWVERGPAPTPPAPGSQLAEDDKRVAGMYVSHLARVSLAIGSEHLMTTVAYANNHHPTMFSMETLLRTAMIGGAQAVWLLSPEERDVRVDRADQLSRDAYWNQLIWAKLLTDGHPDRVDQQELAVAKANLETLTAGKKRAEVQLGRVIREAAEYVFNQPPDPELHNECVAEFRHASGVAHALPWSLNTRAKRVTTEHGGHSGTLYLPSWQQLQGALSDAYAFLHTGWRLLEEGSAA